MIVVVMCHENDIRVTGTFFDAERIEVECFSRRDPDTAMKIDRDTVEHFFSLTL